MSEITTTEFPLQAIGELALRLPMPNAADVTVEVMSADLGDQVEAQRLAWHGLVYDDKHDVLEISVRGHGGHTPDMFRHEIHHPTQIWAEEIDGRMKAVSIMSDEGSQTIVVFHDRPALGGPRE